MKRIGPVLLLALVLGGVHLLANTVNLSYPVMSGLRNKNSFTLEYTTFYTGCQHEERKEERHAQQKRTTLLARLTNEGWVITTFATERWNLERKWPALP